MKTLSRRTLLRGAAGTALALPLLEIMGRPKSALAQAVPGYTAAGYPKRFVVWFTPNGTIPDAWRPSGSETDFTFSRILKPLEPFRNKLLLLDGVDQTGEGGDGHQNGMQGMLTGQSLNPGPFKGGDGGTAGWANGISVDQRIAQVIGSETKFRSLELAVQPGDTENNWNRMCLLGPDQPVPPESSPFKAFERVFKDFSADPATADKTTERNKVVLRGVAENIRQLQARLGAEDKARLDQHLQAVSEIETRLGLKPKAALDSCAKPELASEFDVKMNDKFPVVGKLHMDLMVMALACDLTRVASLMWNRSVGGARFSWVDPSIDRGHHDYSHDGDSATDTVEKLTKINVWYAEQFAYLLQRLDEIPEGDGSMLDNTVVFWCNELTKGNSHTRNDNKYVIAGGAQHFKMGRFLQFDYEQQVRHNNLLLSLVHAMGIEDTSFGKADWCSGPLTGMIG
jgi:hypothetical protein